MLSFAIVMSLPSSATCVLVVESVAFVSARLVLVVDSPAFVAAIAAFVVDKPAFIWPTLTASESSVPSAMPDSLRSPAVPAKFTAAPSVFAPTVRSSPAADCWTRPMVPLDSSLS